jgi:hypothetical protein
MPSRLLRARTLFLGLVVWIAIFAVFVAVRAPRVRAMRCKYMCHVILLVDQYIKDRGGEWPARWADLEKAEVPPDAPPRPGSWPEVRDQVAIDFKADPAALARQTPEEFTAIRPRGDCKDYREEVETLLATLRRTYPSKGGK